MTDTDIEIPQSRLAESAERVAESRAGGCAPPGARVSHQRARLPRVCAGRMGPVRPAHAGRPAQPSRDPARAGRSHARPADGRRPRPSRGAVHQAPVQARDGAFQPIGTSRRRGGRPLLRDLRGDAGNSRLDHPEARDRARDARLAPRDADARQRNAGGAAQAALRAAAVPQALRDEPESARAPGQDAAALRSRPRDAAGARDPLPSRARQLGIAPRRARRRKDGDRRRPRAPHRVRARQGSGQDSRLPDREPADEHHGRGHHAARHVRGPDPERHPRDQGAPESHPVHRRSAHDDRRGVGPRRAVGCGQRFQVGARARRRPDHRRDNPERVQGVHPGGRSARPALPHGAGGRAVDRGDPADSLQPQVAARAQLLGPHLGRRHRDGARDGAALHAAPAAARQGDWVARHRVGQGRDLPSVGRHGPGRRRRHLQDLAHSGRHGVPRRDRALPRRRGSARRAGRRAGRGDRRGGAGASC